MSIFKTMWKYKQSRAWFIIASILIVTVLTVSILASTAFYSVICWVWGGERTIGRNNERYYSITATSKQDAYDRGNALNERICEEGFVLLKNDNGALPLAENEKNISIFGKNSVNLVYGGSGSGGGSDKDAKTIYDSLSLAGFNCNPKLKSFYDSDLSGPGRTNNPKMENDGNVVLGSGETPYSSYIQDQSLINSYADYGDAAVIVFSRIGGEGFDLPRAMDGSANHYLQLDNNEKELLSEVIKAFSKVIVIINSASTMEIKEIKDNPSVDACIHMSGAGSSGVMALGRILNGSVSPSGKTVDTWAANFSENPTWDNFGNYLTQNGGTYTDGVDKNGDPVYTPYYFVDYEEGIYVGYRYYETRGAADSVWYGNSVVYPFGYGLSYTRFDWEIMNPEEINSLIINDGNKSSEVPVKVKVTNTGDSAGKDVVELYCSPPYKGESELTAIEKPAVVLCGFEKTPVLYPLAESDANKPNSAIVTVKFNPYYIASYDHNDGNRNGFKGYELEEGSYKLRLQTDAHNIKAGAPEMTFTAAAGGVRYEKDPVTSVDVINRFDDASEELDTVLSRQNWAGTWPTGAAVHDFGDFSFDKADITSFATNNPVTDWIMPVTDAEVTVKAVELRGLSHGDKKWDALLDSLSFDDLKNLFNQGAFKTAGINKIGLPITICSDGPAGFTNFGGEADIYGTVYYASEVVMGSTWNKELLEQMGEAVGEEANFGKQNTDPYIPYSGWYAPGINIHRSPFGGRNFEYFSEDSFLSGRLAAYEIKGAANKGLITFMKHFALNEQETYRDKNGVCTWATEQSIREIYLRPFEIAVKEAGAQGVMSSFNRIGTKWTGGDYRLLTDILKNEWGFRGSVICDFNVTSYMNTKQMIYAGGDLNLTTTRPWMSASSSSAADMTVLRQAAHNTLYAVINSNAMNGINKDTVLTTAMPIWQIIMIIVDVVIFAGTAATGFLIIRSSCKKAKRAASGVDDDPAEKEIFRNMSKKK